MKNILFGILACLLLEACGTESDATPTVIDLAAGKGIAKTECSDCHGMDGRGETPEIPNLAAQPFEYLIEAMHAYRDGRRQHAALQDMTANMSEADIANIAGYYSSLEALAPITGQPFTETTYVKGAEVAALCEECHGEKGISMTEGVPSLAGQQAAYLITSTLQYKSGERGHRDKAEMLMGVGQVDIERMAMYFASQTVPQRPAPPFGDPVTGKIASAGCGKCHGARGISQDPLIPTLAGQEPVYLKKAIKAYHNNQRSNEAQMPITTTDAQIDNLAAYYAIQHAEAPAEQALSGKTMASKCDRCHNPISGERKLNVPVLRGQSHEYLVKSMQEYRRADRDNSMMHKMSSDYSDEMIEALASYYSGQ